MIAKASSSSSSIKFRTTFRTEFGQSLKLVGSSPSLGTWSLGSAPPMVWSEGHQWTLEVPLETEGEARSIEFKIVTIDTRTDPPAEIWEAGSNRVVKVPKGSGPLLVDCTFGNTAATVAGSLGVPSPTDVAAQAKAKVIAKLKEKKEEKEKEAAAPESLPLPLLPTSNKEEEPMIAAPSEADRLS